MKVENQIGGAKFNKFAKFSLQMVIHACTGIITTICTVYINGTGLRIYGAPVQFNCYQNRMLSQNYIVVSCVPNLFPAEISPEISAIQHAVFLV